MLVVKAEHRLQAAVEMLAEEMELLNRRLGLAAHELGREVELGSVEGMDLKRLRLYTRRHGLQAEMVRDSPLERERRIPLIHHGGARQCPCAFANDRRGLRGNLARVTLP